MSPKVLTRRGSLQYFNMDKYWEWKAEQEKAIQQEQADRQTKVA
jgi:hypothetical protein